jgi:hypothetical protein
MIVVVGIKIPGIHSRIRTEYLIGWTWNEQWNWIEQIIASNKALNWNRSVNQIIIKQFLTGNEHINKHWINHKCHLKEVEMWLSNTCMELNIFVIMEQTITTLFARVLKVWHTVWCVNKSLFASPASWIVVEHGCLTFNTPVQNQSSSIIARIES